MATPFLDAVKNFAIVTVSTGYDAAATAIDLTAGHGARLPAPSTDGRFNLVWWNSTDYANPSDDPNVEIVRVTARSTDALTITRAQEGTSASTKNTSAKTYKMMLTPTKRLSDLISRLSPSDATLTYDSQNRVATIVDTLNSVTYTLSYGTNGLISSITDGTNTWTLTWNNAKQLTAIVKT